MVLEAPMGQSGSPDGGSREQISTLHKTPRSCGSEAGTGSRRATVLVGLSRAQCVVFTVCHEVGPDDLGSPSELSKSSPPYVMDWPFKIGLLHRGWHCGTAGAAASGNAGTP